MDSVFHFRGKLGTPLLLEVVHFGCQIEYYSEKLASMEVIVSHDITHGNDMCVRGPRVVIILINFGHTSSKHWLKLLVTCLL
jgi:hypothetical protein